MRLTRRSMPSAKPAAGGGRGRRGMLAVEDTQRIALQTPAAVFIERVLMRAEVDDELLAIGRAHRGCTERIDLQHQPLDAEPPPLARRLEQQLGLDVRAR